MAQPTSLQFFSHLQWLDGTPLLDTIEDYRRAIFTQALDTFGDDGSPAYNLVLAGRGKKNWKTADLILAGLFVLVIRRSMQGSDGYILANDQDQAADDLTLAKKLVACNSVLAAEIEPLAKELRLRDGSASLKILPAKDIAGAHGKSAAFTAFDEIHGYRNWQLLEALQPDPTRRDALQWITSYASIYNVPGAPLHDLLAIGKAGRDKRMLFSWYSGDFCTDSAFADLPPEQRANPSMASWIDGARYLEQQRTRLPIGRFRRLHLNLPGAPQGAAFDQANILACVVSGRRSIPPEADRRYFAGVDMSGGSSDDAVLCICHVEGRVVVIDLLEKQSGGVPFSPRNAVQKFVAILRDYGIGSVTGDNFAGNTFKSDFEACGITYRSCRRSKSDLYEALEPKLNAREVELPDYPTLIEQAVCLVWRGQRIDHEPGSHDDWINATAIAVFIALDRRDADALPIMSGKVWNGAGVKIADGVSAFFDRLVPKPAPSTNQELHERNQKDQHEEMRKSIEPNRPPVDWDALAAAKKEREANQPPKLMFYGKLFGGYR
jgi:hypothetical protein